LSVQKLFSFRQKALKALNDRMKVKDTVTEAWPDLNETPHNPLLPPTHQVDYSSTTIDMNNTTEMSTITKEDLNQQQTKS
jgi:hypothetical protein